ncbi:HlyD family efflux transporter periplasmic adaptor subunit [Lacibacterium aquatile]|uniref:HlyD family efflux transporter periplasmic adaptor subunit n=1 Tax=Lacibacterium aquatile TaxID=1168082 RepID=A0ABW5DTF4_9PROT
MEPGAILLPPLREDIVLHRAASAPDGAPGWTLHDPLANRFFAIDWLDFEMLALWRGSVTPDGMVEALGEARPDLVANGLISSDRVRDLLGFLAANRLLQPVPDSGWRHLAEQARRAAAAQSPWKQALHHYLFFRIPLFRPDGLLRATEPAARLFFQPAALLMALLLGVIGLLLAFRQWDGFANTFLYFFSPLGLVWYGGALVVAKAIHEMGHAWIARRYWVPVPRIGVAFMVLWPMLYTDTTHAWKLRSRFARLHIAAGGLIAETWLANLALLAWNFLPDGPARSAAFLLATTSWFMTLAVNLNPLMRFDGYYLLSDALGIANLQDRSFAVGRWYLRRCFLGLEAPCPEAWGPGQRRLLALYAYACWIYRAGLFIGIALLVYHVSFKLLGLFLMAVEVGWFILRPIWNELFVWWRSRGEMAQAGTVWRPLALFVGAIGLLFVPWHSPIDAPAMMRPAEARLYSAENAMIAAVHVSLGQSVAVGDLLLQLVSPGLERAIQKAQGEIALFDQHLARAGGEPRGQNRAQLQENRARIAAELQTLQVRRQQLRLTAPFAGEITAIGEDIQPGRWVAAQTPLALLVDAGQPVVRAYIPEIALPRIVPGGAARFIPDGRQLDPQPLRVSEVDRGGLSYLDEPALAATNGGPLAVVRQADGRLMVRDGIYRIRLDLAGETAAAIAVPGRVLIDAPSQSLADRLWNWLLPVLIRESGLG